MSLPPQAIGIAIATCHASAMCKTCAGEIERRSAAGIRFIREGSRGSLGK